METPQSSWQHLFNRGDYIPALLALEQIWFRERDDLHKGLIRMCAGVNQMRLGLDDGPRFLLSSARELLAPYGASSGGLDLHAVDRFLAACLQLLDEQPARPRTVPPFAFPLDPPTDEILLHTPKRGLV